MLVYLRNEFRIHAQVVRFVIIRRGERQADRAGREVVDLPPDHRTDIETVIGSIHVNPLSAHPVSEYHIEASGHRNEELLQFPMGVSASISPSGDIVEIIDPLYIETHVSSPLDEGKIASWILDFGQLNYLAIL